LDKTSATGSDVSVVMLTRDAGRLLLESLGSIGWAREVIALDAGSRDGTCERLRACGALVLPQDSDLVRAHDGNFDIARNAGLERAQGSWVLVLDADEVVTDGLRGQILRATSRPARVAYEIPRVNFYWGRPSRVLGEDLQLRLFPRSAARYGGTQLDQPVNVDCPVERLTEPLHHYQRDLLRTLRERTDQRARRAVRRGEVPDTPAASLFWHHLRWYTLRQGVWREGPRGLVLAALYAAYPALTAIKARRLARAEAGRHAGRG
jgi:glycosyltransferase involved in cell wall biosynthesis